MMRALFTASTGMHAQQLNTDTLAHNMANVNTIGFKKQRIEFQDLLYQTIRRPAADENRNEPVGLHCGRPGAVRSGHRVAQVEEGRFEVRHSHVKMRGRG